VRSSTADVSRTSGRACTATKKKALRHLPASPRLELGSLFARPIRLVVPIRSITKMVNRSDHDIAGLMLRCAEGATTEVLVVLIEPLQLRTHPKVTVAAGARTPEFTASVVTPGALVLLPEKASALVEHAWQSVPELAVTIAENHGSLHGVIPLADINTAMQTLQSNCQKRGG
jgi:hypothetical protein